MVSYESLAYSGVLQVTKPTCRVKVRLTYVQGRIGCKSEPYKWGVECTCGWRALSWSWSREYDCYTVHGYRLDDGTVGPNPEQWIEDNGGKPDGGALVMALDHVGLWREKLEYQPMFGGGEK